MHSAPSTAGPSGPAAGAGVAARDTGPVQPTSSGDSSPRGAVTGVAAASTATSGGNDCAGGTPPSGGPAVPAACGSEVASVNSKAHASQKAAPGMRSAPQLGHVAVPVETAVIGRSLEGPGANVVGLVDELHTLVAVGSQPGEPAQCTLEGLTHTSRGGRVGADGEGGLLAAAADLVEADPEDADVEARALAGVHQHLVHARPRLGQRRDAGARGGEEVGARLPRQRVGPRRRRYE